MSWLRSILDAALETTARTSLRLLGRDVNADEDHLLPQSDRDTVINRCHDLRRNNAIAAGVADGLADNVVGTRLRLQARTSSQEWNSKAERWLRAWFRRADTAGRSTMAEILRETVQARLFEGELFLVPHPSGAVTVVESQRVRGESGEPAFEVDAMGRVTRWRIADRDPETGDFRAGGPARLVRDAIHVAWRTRPDQVRGWPQFATVANICQDVGEINAANLTKYKIGSMNSFVLTGGGKLKGRGKSGNAGTEGVHPLSKFHEGMIFELEDGQDIHSFRNDSPGGEYAPFVELNLRLVGMALRLPYEFLLMYFGGGTFAASKAALEQVHVTLSGWQDWLEEKALRPLVAWRIAKAVADGELPAAPVDETGRSEWDRWEWQRPAMLWLDPQAAIQTEMQEVRMGVRPLSSVAAVRGNDLEETLRLRARELKLAAEIEKEYGLAAGSLSLVQIPGQKADPAANDEGRTTKDEGEAAQ